ncbi:MAG: 1-acyl-sn-glycerol-3-phosphate acyltransferase [Bacteroidales bacterium]|nr:1-acyl-sn-glycerol-3-phosphate acyltransferase [Bacteroidales bacterium]
MTTGQGDLIDIEAIVRTKLGSKADRIPAWIYRLLPKIIHQDFINVYLKEGRRGVDFCEGVIDYLGVEVEVQGLENIPAEDGRFTFVSNHPLGAIDGVTLGAVLGKRYDGKVKYLVNDFLMNLKGLAPLCVPINKTGGQSRNLPALLDEAFFHPENQVIMFPAGLCSRKINGKVQDLPWGKAFISKSVASKRDVVPIHFEGRNSSRFYRVANLCRKLGLKFNLAMILLPDEMYRSKGRKYSVKIGKPIPYSTFDHSKSAQEWAQTVRAAVYEL